MATRPTDSRQLLADLAYQIILTHELSSFMCKDNNISCSQLMVLKRLNEAEETCCKTLSSELKMVPSTLTGVCDVLETKGYVTRHYSGVDRRRVYVSLTDSGRSYLDHTRNSIIDHLNSVSQTFNFNESDIEKTTLLLQKFNQEF